MKADVTCKSSDQTAHKCGLIKVFAWHQCRIVGNHLRWFSCVLESDTSSVISASFIWSLSIDISTPLYLNYYDTTNALS